MGKITFDNGLRTYEVNGKTTISFNPTDINFANSVFGLADLFEKIRERNSSVSETDNIYEVIKESDKEMRAAVDAVFGEGVSSELFGRFNVFSPCDGLPMVLNFLLAILDEIDASVETAINPNNDRVNGYVARYEAKYGKK